PCDGSHLHLRSFPTRRSSDLSALEPSRLRARRIRPLSFNWKTASRVSSGVALGVNEVRTERWQAYWTMVCKSGRLSGSPPVSTKDRKSTRLNSSHVKISYAVF